jgi:hypothetical protein
MSGAIKAVGSGIGNLAGGISRYASPLINMVPGGNYLNAGLGILGQAGGGGAPTAPPGSTGGSFLDWFKNPQNLALLGLGAGGAYAASKMGALDPRVVTDPRNTATGDLSKLLSGALGGNLGQIFQSGMLPGYTGQFGAGTTSGQQSDIDIVQQALQKFASGDQGQGALQGLNQFAQGGFNVPPEIMSLFGGGGGQNILQGIGGGSDPVSQMLMQLSGTGNPAIDQLLNFQSNSPERQLLLQAGGQNVIGQGQGLLGQAGQLLNSGQGLGAISSLLGGGAGTDINQVAAMLDQARQPALQRDLGNLREQFSFNGLRNSTDLNQGAATLLGNSQAALTGQLANLMPQLAGLQSQNQLGGLSALTSLAGTQGNLGQMAGNLGLGQQQNVLSAFGQAGQLGQGGMGQQLQALLGGGNLLQGQTGQQGNILQSLLGTQLGAGQALQTGGTNQADILSRLFSGQQSNQLQALLGQPGAISMLSQLPGVLGQNAFNLAQGGQNNADTIIQRMIANSTQQQSLMPQILQFLGGTPQQQVGDSLFSQLGGLLAAGAGLKASK